MDQALLDRMDDLNVELKRLGQRMSDLRYEDFKRIFCDELARWIEDHSEVRVVTELDRMPERSSCHHRSDCPSQLKEMLREAMRAVQEDDPQEAWDILDRTELMIRGDASPCQDPRCTDLALRVLARAKDSMELFASLRSRMSSSGTVAKSPGPGIRHPPADTAALLTSLANPKRLEIMRVLESGDQSFSEISRAVGLRTGHLQFHLRPLLEADLVRFHGRGKTYSITARGREAMVGIDALMTRVSAVEYKRKGPGP